MGNQQSKPPRHQRKLAKPKTNNSASNLLLVAGQVAEATVVPSLDATPTTLASIQNEDVVVVGATGDRRSRSEARQKLRDHLCRFESSQSLDLPPAEEESVGNLATIISGVKDRISRSSSLSSSLVPSAKTSMTLLNPLGGSRLSLIAEPTTLNTGAEKLIKTAIEEGGQVDGLTELEQMSFSSTRGSLGRSALAPIRRRSLLTPGLATRGCPTDVLRKAPPPEDLVTQADRDYYFNSAFPDVSPLARLAALDLADQGRCSPIPRVSTPSDLEFSFLGGFKPGTLRITNGAASPVPSEMTMRNFSQTMPSPEIHSDRSEDEYFSASEGRKTPEDEGQPVLKDVCRLSGEFVAAINRSRPSSGDFGRIGRPLTQARSGNPPRCDSPLKHESVQDDSSLWAERLTVAEDDVSVKRRSLSLFEAPMSSPDRASAMAHEYMRLLPKPLGSSSPPRQLSLVMVKSPISCPDLAKEIAENYMQELPRSPFSFVESRPATPRLEVTSRRTAVEADLFEDEGIVTTPILESTNQNNQAEDDSMNQRQKEILREQALAVLDGTNLHPPPRRFALSASSSSSSSLSYRSSSGSEGVVSKPWAPALKPLTKSDSGYESLYSVQSVTRRTTPHKQDSGIAGPSRRPDSSKGPAKSNAESWLEQGFEVTQVPPLRRNTGSKQSGGVRCPSRDKELPALPPAIRSSVTTEIVEVSMRSITPPKPGIEFRKSMPACEKPLQTPASPDRHTPHKLRKRRPRSQPPLPLPVSSITVQTYRNISQTHIPPPIPVEVASKYAQRMSKYSPLALFKPKNSVMTLEKPSRPPLSTVPSVDTVSLAHRSSEALVASQHPPAPLRDYSIITRPTLERRSSWQRLPGQSDFVTGLDNGQRPSDESGTEAPQNGSTISILSRRRSYDSSELERRMSMSGSLRGRPISQCMNEEEAAVFARERSRHRSRSQGRASDGGIPLRPRSMYDEPQPPVPALPSKEELERKTAAAACLSPRDALSRHFITTKPITRKAVPKREPQQTTESQAGRNRSSTINYEQIRYGHRGYEAVKVMKNMESEAGVIGRSDITRAWGLDFSDIPILSGA